MSFTQLWERLFSAEDRKTQKLLLVCSSGGHLLQMVQLRPAWQGRERIWVTFDKADARSLLAEENVVYAHFPTNRNIPNLLRNGLLAWRLVWRERPDVVLSTGAGVAIPFCYLGWLFGAHVIYIESIARVKDISLTGKVVAPIVHRFFVQSEELLRLVPGAQYLGKVY
jgi:UDP-N-acetylglucosamine:LPS N-acetylglucosamine transferase